MKQWMARVLAITLLAVSICAALVCYSPYPRDPSGDELGRLRLEPGTGRATGIVVDRDEFLPEGVTPQTYEGASIVINKAVEAGTYKLSEEEPECINSRIQLVSATLVIGN
jgi:hypothetical protein